MPSPAVPPPNRERAILTAHLPLEDIGFTLLDPQLDPSFLAHPFDLGHIRHGQLLFETSVLFQASRAAVSPRVSLVFRCAMKTRAAGLVSASSSDHL
jgi:hypothetical protein